MANILDRYGIKEVADVTFYELNDNGVPTKPVLYLDTLKVSTIEQTAETSDARGGKGNAKLISWDYNKEITVTLEDALFSARSLAIMFGDGSTANYNYDGEEFDGDDGTTKTDTGKTKGLIMKTERFTASADGDADSTTGGSGTIKTVVDAAKAAGWKDTFRGPDGKTYKKLNPKFYDVEKNNAPVVVVQGNKEFIAGKVYFCTYDVKVAGTIIEVSANSFPGTYYVTGDTFARNENSGRDEFFQFIIPKAKVTSENTLTLEAEGDPSVFNMNLSVLRPADGVMMKLVKYDLLDGDTTAPEASNFYHNHVLA